MCTKTFGKTYFNLNHVLTTRSITSACTSTNYTYFLNSLGRPYNLSVAAEPPPVPLRVSIEVPRVFSRSVERPYATYEVLVTVRPSHRKTSLEGETLTFSQEHRYSDFCSLLDALRTEFPLSTIPSLPRKQVLGDKTKEAWMVENRRRQLRLWLQYIVMHPSLQVSSSILTFLAGSETSKITNLLEQLSPDSSSRMSLIQSEILIEELNEEVGDKENFEKLLVGSSNSYSSKQCAFAKRLIATVFRYKMILLFRLPLKSTSYYTQILFI